MPLPTDFINNEMLRIKNMKYNLVYLYSDFLLKGNLNMMHKLARDAAMLQILDYTVTRSILFERDQTFTNDAIYKAREYMNSLNVSTFIEFFTPSLICSIYDIGESSSIPNLIINNVTNITNIYNVQYSEDWESQVLTISSEGQTVIEDLNFYIEYVDIDTVMLEVQGDNPEYTTVGSGYHMVGNTLYWHNTYRLRPGMQIKIRWKT